jgi:hypothetical protein
MDTEVFGLPLGMICFCTGFPALLILTILVSLADKGYLRKLPRLEQLIEYTIGGMAIIWLIIASIIAFIAAVIIFGSRILLLLDWYPDFLNYFFK